MSVLILAKAVLSTLLQNGYTWETVGYYHVTDKHIKMSYSWKIHEALKINETNFPERTRK